MRWKQWMPLGLMLFCKQAWAGKNSPVRQKTFARSDAVYSHPQLIVPRANMHIVAAMNPPEMRHAFSDGCSNELQCCCSGNSWCLGESMFDKFVNPRAASDHKHQYLNFIDAFEAQLAATNLMEGATFLE